MKKALTFLLLFIPFMAVISVGYAQEEKAVISKVNGEVDVIRKEGLEPAVQGMAIKSGDLIKTSEGASLDIAMNNLAGFRVLESSDLTVKSAHQKDMQLKIAKGNIILNLQKLPEGTSFSMETPTAVAAVRGTQFWGRVNGSRANQSVTTLAVREGTVEVTVKSSGETFALNQGQALDIPVGAEAPSVRKALDAEMAAMSQASEIVTTL